MVTAVLVERIATEEDGKTIAEYEHNIYMGIIILILWNHMELHTCFLMGTYKSFRWSFISPSALLRPEVRSLLVHGC